MVATDPVTPEPRRFAISLPRPLWIGLATVVLIVVAVGLHFGVPIYRQHVVIREIERVGGNVETRPRGPKWLRERVGNERMKLFENVVQVSLATRPATDFTLDHVGCLTCCDRKRSDERYTETIERAARMLKAE